MTSELPSQIQAVVEAAQEADLKAQHRQAEPDARLSLRFVYQLNEELEQPLHWFHSTAGFPIPIPTAGQTVRVLTEEPLLVDRVELSYEIVPGGTQHVTADVYVTVPNP